MRTHGKRYNANKKVVDRTKKFVVAEAVTILKGLKPAKFDETVDVALVLGVDPKHADQQVRGAVVLPHGIGKQVRVVVFAKGDKEREAKAAGADEVGAEELVKKIEGGWLDFDKVIATPDMMGQVGKLGKVLGPRGLMPNPKVGTVTTDVTKAVTESKAGKVEFRVDKAGIVHAPVGKVSFAANKLTENVTALLETVAKLKPPAAKGTYMQTATLSSSMSPGIRLDISKIGVSSDEE
ncbi:MAG: 50S ribosomal protein L1 [Deltaproteobacteria bacterium]|nr:50S ribosomal protein L1 [Deltaproteobacteria bacterium]